MKQPRHWRLLKRHPLSTQYQDIKGESWKEFVAGVREHGIVKNRKIILHEGMVLDGWQLQRACVEIGKAPVYEGLPPKMTAEEYVQTFNDLRRHETQEAAEARIVQRRERVAKARAEGESIREIAQQENVDPKTIQNDLKKSEKQPTKKQEETPNYEHDSGQQRLKTAQKTEENGISRVETSTPEKKSENTPIIGRDGKTYLATRTKTGKPLFKDRDVTDLFGKLARLVQERANVYGRSAASEACRKSLDDFLTKFDQWRHA